MCEAKVFLESKSGHELVMKDVVTIKPAGDSLELLDLFGEKKVISADIKEIKLLDHKVILEPRNK